jgi:integrase
MAPPRKRRRRSPGNGSVWPYRTRAGQVWYTIGYMQDMPDGTRKSVTRRKGPHGEKWATEKDAEKALRGVLAQMDKGEFIEPSRQPFGAYGLEVIDGLRIGAQTRASYLKNWRLHVEVYPLASVPLAQLPGAKLTSHYRTLERSGRKDHKAGEGLSPRTVRYMHTIISRVLRQAVKDGQLARNPADAATPPTAREAKAPEMTCWSAGQLAAFLAWSADRSQHNALWSVLAYTGMRRGEALALRWRDVDTGASTLSIRRSAGMVRVAGEGADVVEGDTKSGKPRVIDLDAATVAVLKAHRKARGVMALQLARDDALVFGDIEGAHRNPEHTSRQFVSDVRRCRKEKVADLRPIRLHDLRHTHATILLTAREPVHVVSQRLGHASAVVTMTVYAHVLPGSQREAADLFARLVAEAAS